MSTNTTVPQLGPQEDVGIISPLLLAAETHAQQERLHLLTQNRRRIRQEVAEAAGINEEELGDFFEDDLAFVTGDDDYASLEMDGMPLRRFPRAGDIIFGPGDAYDSEDEDGFGEEETEFDIGEDGIDEDEDWAIPEDNRDAIANQLFDQLNELRQWNHIDHYANTCLEEEPPRNPFTIDRDGVIYCSKCGQAHAWPEDKSGVFLLYTCSQGWCTLN